MAVHSLIPQIANQYGRSDPSSASGDQIIAKSDHVMIPTNANSNTVLLTSNVWNMVKIESLSQPLVLCLI